MRKRNSDLKYVWFPRDQEDLEDLHRWVAEYRRRGIGEILEFYERQQQTGLFAVSQQSKQIIAANRAYRDLTGRELLRIEDGLVDLDRLGDAFNPDGNLIPEPLPGFPRTEADGGSDES